jgi:hypothetical protein
MTTRIWLALLLVGAFLLPPLLVPRAPACCPAPPYRPGDKGGVLPVVNADQTVIMIWDAATNTQHFIRKASFKSQADDFGFLVPTPAQPELNESGNEAFPYLYDLTKPEIVKQKVPQGGGGCILGCGGVVTLGSKSAAPEPVRVLEAKLVAGLQASVLETKSATALVNWLKDNGYAFSPEVAAWAKPYVEAGWMITALKVAKAKDSTEKQDVAASALRLSFETDRPLFPYREPDSGNAAQALGTNRRLLRIYFLADARYQGQLTEEVPWTGKVAWAGELSPKDRQRTLELLKLPENTGPAAWWLTEFEDEWPYRVAPADVYFSRSESQSPLKRPPMIEYVALPFPTDLTAYALAAAVLLPPLVRRVRHARCHRRSEANRGPGTI